MKMIETEAQMDLVRIIHSINKDPESWENWMCLHIALPRISADEASLEAMDCIRPLLESCLQDIEGSAYFCDQGDIFIVCKNTSSSVLQEVARHVCDLVIGENMVTSDFKIFDLAHDGQSFVDYYYAQDKRFTVFSLPDALSDKKHGRPDAIFAPREEPASKNLQRNSSIKVLLVEDDPVTRWMVRNALRSKCQFATAQTGNKALALYSSYQPDIVFLDINLPERNGLSVLDWIMEHDPGAYVVMFSSEGNLDTIVNTLEDGAKGFIAKPFRKEQLIHYIGCCPTAH